MKLERQAHGFIRGLMTKEIFWNTLGAEGIEWRLAVVHWV